jgi:Cys-Gly metallodipeptidase DUG1
MEPADLSKLVSAYLQKTFQSLNTKNTLKVEELHAGKWWVASPDHWNYRAAAKAVENVFNVKPDLTREGGSIPVTLTFQDCLGKNVLLLPMGRGMHYYFTWANLGDDGAHSTNEKLDLSNYIQGICFLEGF